MLNSPKFRTMLMVVGGTTCSSTLIFSALAGIKVFATGGYAWTYSGRTLPVSNRGHRMGGVHRGGENCAPPIEFFSTVGANHSSSL